LQIWKSFAADLNSTLRTALTRCLTNE